MRFLIILLIITLSGCAAGYKPYSSLARTGYTETELQRNMWQVRYTGNNNNTQESASDYAYLRAAELCMLEGLQYFQVFNSNSETTSSGAVSTGVVNSYGNGVYLPALTSVTINIPSAEVTVLCQADNSMDEWDADFLIGSIHTKYNIK